MNQYDMDKPLYRKYVASRTKKWSILIKLDIVPDTTNEQLGAQHNMYKIQEWIFYTNQPTREILYKVMNERDLNASLKNA